MTSVFEIFAKLGLDSSDFDKGLDNAKSTLSNMGSAVGSGLGTIAKIGTAAVATASAGIAALGTMAVKGYADYEQLTGGVETLFKTSSNAVMDYANNAYKTAGLTANDYMETVTGFSASLISSLDGDTAKAAEIANMSITDMSDNANKMGTDIESIKTAYQGFAKQNYTMLDNLKLGYGGTKQEMERLLADAEKLTGQKYDISNFSDIAEAIHAIQTEMDITGTTAKEAGSTISGSVASMKSAWDNLVVGLADGNADLGQLIDNVVTSAETAFNNILPVAEQALMGIGQLVTDLAPIIGQKLPELITNLLPQILETGVQFIGALGQGIIDNLPALVDAAVQIVVTLVTGIVGALPQLAEGAVELITSLGEALIDNGDELLDAGSELLDFVVDGVANGLPKLLDSGTKMLENLYNGFWNNLPKMITAVGKMANDMLNYILKNLPQFMSKGADLLINIVNGFINNLPQIVAAVVQMISQLVSTIAQNLPQILQQGVEIIGKLVAGLIQAIPKVVAAIPKIISSIVTEFGKYDWLKIGTDIIKGIAKGITGAAGEIARAAKNAAKKAFDAAKDFLGIHSPSRLMRDQVGRYISEGIAVGIEDNLNSITNSMNDVADLVSQPIDVGEVGMTGGSGSGNAYNSSNSVVINVYGAVGQNVNELAEIVSRKINASVNRRGAAWA